jgi:hypothetical protein
MSEEERRRGRDAATAPNKRSSMLYLTISNRPRSNDDIMVIFAKKFGTDFVTLEISKM